MTTFRPTAPDDLIDSRDVIARIEKLEAELNQWIDETPALSCTDIDILLDEAQVSKDDAALLLGSGIDIDELRSLRELADEASGALDWGHGEMLIRDSYFETYARELAEDTGAIKNDVVWPMMYIDWDAAADALKQDYMCVTFDGVEYWIRA